MLVEIPQFRRCCCCLPLRRGILIFAYLNLIVTLFFGILHLLLWILILQNSKKNQAVGMYRGVVMEVEFFFIIVLHVLDVIFNIVLIVGAHMKNSRLMKIFYYYQMTTMIANFVVLLVTYRDYYSSWEIQLSELSVAFLGFVIQIYLLLLIFSELNKQRYQEGRSSFVNQMSEVCLEPPVRLDRRILL